jgi:(2Fe-2S) ferredoxin
MSANPEVLVCQQTSCLAENSAAILAKFQQHGAAAVAGPCQGQCHLAPTVRILTDQTWYCRVRLEDVGTIATQHLVLKTPVAKILHPRFHPR